jgi:hypothetical protein
MAGELSCLATGVKAGGRRRFEQRGHKEEHFEQEVAEFTKVSRIGIRIGGGGPKSELWPLDQRGLPPESSEKNLEVESFLGCRRFPPAEILGILPLFEKRQ